MINIIFSYKKKEPKYFQILLTIESLISIDERKTFEILLLKSKLEKKKIILINQEKDLNQDFITMKNLTLE